MFLIDNDRHNENKWKICQLVFCAACEWIETDWIVQGVQKIFPWQVNVSLLAVNNQKPDKEII